LNSSATIAALTNALLAAQKEMKNPTFDSENPHFKSRFASLSTVRESVLPILLKHGLVLTQFPKSADGYAGCINKLLHISGEWLEEECLLPLDKNNAQGAGSAITYARRYSFQSIAGVVADEDDDANAASAPVSQKKGHSPGDGALEHLTKDEVGLAKEIAATIVDLWESDKPVAAYEHFYEAELSNEMKLGIWELLRPNSKVRNGIKKIADANKEKVAA
jgi:hypothetical protein